jgi:hypothetical protein
MRKSFPVHAPAEFALVRFLTMAVLLALCQSGLAASEAQMGEAKSDRLGLRKYHFRVVHMEQARPGLCIRVSINNKPAALAVDSGSPVTTLDRNTIAGYGLNERPTSKGVNSPIGHSSEHLGVSKTRSIELANIVLSNDAMPVANLNAMNRGSAIHIAGIFGLSQMRRLGAVIDCGRRTLYLNPNGATRDSQAKLNESLVNRGFVRVPMHINRAGNPEVSCRVNEVESKIVVETAAHTTIVSKQIAASAGVRLTATGSTVEGAGRTTSALSSGTAKRFSVGTFHTQEQRLSAAELSFAVLGIDYLSAHDAVIDCGSMNLFLSNHARKKD